MPAKKKHDADVDRWVDIVQYLQVELPHVMGWLNRRDDFAELRLKARDDGTILAIAKGYGADGGPMVAFGVGYDVVLALMALGGSIQANRWRPDKPWTPG